MIWVDEGRAAEMCEVLIVGASGFLGRRVAAGLREAGCLVSGFCRSSSSSSFSSSSSCSPWQQLFEGSVLDAARVREVLRARPFAAVLFLAGVTANAAIAADPAAALDVQVKQRSLLLSRLFSSFFLFALFFVAGDGHAERAARAGAGTRDAGGVRVLGQGVRAVRARSRRREHALSPPQLPRQKQGPRRGELPVLLAPSKFLFFFFSFRR